MLVSLLLMNTVHKTGKICIKKGAKTILQGSRIALHQENLAIYPGWKELQFVDSMFTFGDIYICGKSTLEASL